MITTSPIIDGRNIIKDVLIKHLILLLVIECQEELDSGKK